MDQSARVTSIDALRRFKSALMEFCEAAQLALGEGNIEVQRIHSWLQNDRLTYWKQQLKLRNNRLTDAKAELMRAQIASQDGRGSASLESKNVIKWKRLVEEAEEKIQAVKKWTRNLDREVSLFKARCQPLARTVSGEMDKAFVKIDRATDALEKYTKLAPPSSTRVTSATPASYPGDEAVDPEPSETEE